MPRDSRELNVLLNKLLDETIGQAEFERLQACLRGNPEVIKDYLFQIDIHAHLKELEGRTEEESQLVGTDPGLQGSEGLCSVRPCGTRNRFRLWILASATLLAVAVPTLVFSPIWRGGDHQPAIVGGPQDNRDVSGQADSPSSSVRLTQAAHAELFLEQIPKLGATMKVGHEYSLSNGQIELTFDNGASALLQSPAVFTIQSPNRLEMKIGVCSVHAPETAKGFEVITPQGRVVDLGTRFSVAASELGVSDVQVIEGAVKYHSQASRETGEMLLEGEAVRIPEASQKEEAIPFDRRQFRDTLPDRVVSYEAAQGPNQDGVQDLLNVTVQRGGIRHTYTLDQLIDVDLLHFSSYSKRNSACSADPGRPDVQRMLTGNRALNSGITNFDRAPGPYVPATSFQNFRDRNGLAVQFHRPVKNGPGPDIVLFELQSTSYPIGGDRFYVSPIENGPGFKTYHVEEFDLTMRSANALQVAPLFTHHFENTPRSLEELFSMPVTRSTRLHVPFYALAVGLDLSDLGYRENESAPGIFIEDADEDEYVAIDVVFIGGFPDL